MYSSFSHREVIIRISNVAATLHRRCQQRLLAHVAAAAKNSDTFLRERTTTHRLPRPAHRPTYPIGRDLGRYGIVNHCNGNTTHARRPGIYHLPSVRLFHAILSSAAIAVPSVLNRFPRQKCRVAHAGYSDTRRSSVRSQRSRIIDRRAVGSSTVCLRDSVIKATVIQEGQSRRVFAGTRREREPSNETIVKQIPKYRQTP